MSYQDRIIDALIECESFTAPQEAVLVGNGKRASVLDAIRQLKKGGVVVESGTPHSPTNPLKLTLKPEKLPMHDFMNGRQTGRANLPGGNDRMEKMLSLLMRGPVSHPNTEAQTNGSNPECAPPSNDNVVHANEPHSIPPTHTQESGAEIKADERDEETVIDREWEQRMFDKAYEDSLLIPHR